ncbi:ATP-binding protein [Paenibacillus sp. FSL M7-1046]|uniref:ATP-binding protein n=1 Tax=Paenibacillus sp. FSL M7-1046 TaxID=2975315 RepID=UPI0030FB8CF7
MKNYDVQLPISSKLFWTMGNQNLTIGRAIAEFVDNSIDARQAVTSVNVELFEDKIIVSDTSSGMDLPSLVQALTPAESKKALGTAVGGYGFGLKTASAFLGNCLEITTCEAEMDTALYVKLENTYDDLSDFYSHSSSTWDITVFEIDKPFDKGTVITLSRLGRPRYKSDMENVINHFSKTFSSFIQNKELELKVNGDLVNAYIFDPYWKKEFDFSVTNMNGQKCNVNGWVGVSKSPEKSTTSKTDNGFHLYLNGRLLNYATWIGLDRHPEMRLLVGEIHLENFKSNVTKTEIISDSQEYIEFEEAFIEWLKKNNIRKLIDNNTKELIRERKKEQKAINEKQGNAAGGVLEPAAGETPEPAAGGAPGLAAGGAPEPAAGGVPEPAAGGAPGPAAGGAPGPAAGGAPEPAAGGAPGPAAGGAPGPAAGGAPGPAAGGAPEPAAGGAPGPAVGGTPEPATGGAPEPAAGESIIVTEAPIAELRKPKLIKKNGAEKGIVVLNIQTFFNPNDFVEAIDYSDKKLPVTIRHKGVALDINTPGEYVLCYIATDQYSRSSIADIRFLVVDPSVSYVKPANQNYTVKIKAQQQFSFTENEYRVFNFSTGELSKKIQDTIIELNNLDFTKNKIAMVSLFRILIELCCRKACTFYSDIIYKENGLATNVNNVFNRLKNKLPADKASTMSFANDTPLSDKLAKEFSNFIDLKDLDDSQNGMKKSSVIDLLNLYMHHERRIPEDIIDYWEATKPFLIACLMLPMEPNN